MVVENNKRVMYLVPYPPARKAMFVFIASCREETRKHQISPLRGHDFLPPVQVLLTLKTEI